jgi:acyl dehydratase
MTERYFDDFKVGECFVSESSTLTESEIIGFARKFDPQFFHLDREAAKASPFGGLIASGFHTLSLGFRLFIDTGVIDACGMGSPGMEQIRWLQPVRPGDSIRTEARVVEMRPSGSKSDRGVLIMDFEVKNQRGEAVLTMRAVHLLRRKGQNGS